MSRVTSDVVFMFYAVRSKCVDEPLDARVEAALRFQLALTDKQIVDLVIYGRSTQELGQRFFGIDITGAEYTNDPKRSSALKPTIIVCLPPMERPDSARPCGVGCVE
jgi:hypothetical protein